MYTGPHIIKDGLVFGYDTGYGIANTTVQTKHYKGSPISNHINGGANRANAISSPSHGSHGSTVTTEIISHGERENVFRIYSTNTAGYYMVNQQSSIINTSGNTYTYSFDYKQLAGAADAFSPSAIYKNGYKSPDSSGSGTNITDTTVDLEHGWKRFTRTYISSYTGYNFFRTNLFTRDTKDFDFLFDNFMINEGGVAPFVDSTRSSTASIIDLKETTDIDLSNVSFDSTGQPSFDETDDHITGVLPMKGLGAPHTVEMVFSCNVNQGSIGSRKDPFSIGNSAIHQYSALDVNTSNMNWYFYGRDTTFTNSPLMVAGKYYHMVFSYAGGASNNTNKKVWMNNIQQTLSSGSSETPLLPDNPSFSVGRDRGRNTAYWPGDIPVFKVYDRALSATEVKQNYNAYKNRFDI